VTDWRDALLRGFANLDPPSDAGARNPIGWPGYQPRAAVGCATGSVNGHRVVAAVWDFESYGGSFSERDASAFGCAVDEAVARRLPLVTLARTGGVRLQEGMAALVGMPRAQLALQRLAAAGLPHVGVADAPTTGGVFVSILSRADVRVAVDGATVGFAGPRVVEAVTGRPPGPDSHTAVSAYAAGLVDAVVAPGELVGWLTGALRALDPGLQGAESTAEQAPALPDRAGDEQVAAARDVDRPSAGALLDRLVPDAVDLRAAGGDQTVRAAVGHLADGQPVVAVAVAAERRGRPAPAGYRLVVRAAQTAGRLRRPLLTLVDTPGAEPSTEAETAGIAAAIGDAMDAVLGCPAPTVSLIVGEGGSGGALAVAVTDLVLVTPGSYFAALGPEGAAAALRTTPGASARRLRLRPQDLLALGFADAAVPEPDDPELGRYVGAAVSALAALDPADRHGNRLRRWSAPLPGAAG